MVGTKESTGGGMCGSHGADAGNAHSGRTWLEHQAGMGLGGRGCSVGTHNAIIID